MNQHILKVKLNHPNAVLPVRGSQKAAGLDLHACEEIIIPPRKHLLVPTGIQVAIPEGYYGRVAPRSGLAYKFALDVGAGVVDEDYRGNIGVIIFNHSDSNYHVKVGERIAQFILEKISYASVQQVQVYFNFVLFYYFSHLMILNVGKMDMAQLENFN